MTPAEQEARAKALAFLDELRALCEHHGVCLSHEDTHGRFVLDWGRPGSPDPSDVALALPTRLVYL